MRYLASPAACRAMLALAAWGLGACTQSVEVLGSFMPALGDVPDGGLTDAPDLPDAPPTAGDAASGDPPGDDAGALRCDGCGGLSLCTPDGCIDTAGPTALETGRHHTCLVRDGRLYCWGLGGDGQLGNGDREDRDRPTRVGSANDWRIASGGERHSCGIRAPGTLWCWGDNTLGQLGLGDIRTRLEPSAVGGPADWVDLDCGGDNCCALREGGRLYCWGDNLEGKPGQGDPFGEPDVLVPSEVAGERRYRSVALGQGHVCAIDDGGGLWCWGRNVMGETGTAAGEGQTRSPRAVAPGTAWTSVSGSQHHSCGTQQDGSLWCWGWSPFGELGHGVIDDDEAVFVAEPARVGDAGDWARVEVGWFHSCALKDGGRILCWGRSIEGQLGEGGIDPVPTPTPATTEARFETLALGGFHTCAIDLDGRLQCWGMNESGQLGLGDRERRYEPTPVP